MIRLTSLIVFFLLPVLGWAQTAQIESGEHSSFSRLAVQFTTQTSWTFGKTPDGYGLRTSNDIDFSIADIFKKIPKTRLTRATKAPGELNLSNAPNTHAIAFEVRPGRVIIDIRSGPAPAGSEFEAALNSTPSKESGEQPAVANNPTALISEDRASISGLGLVFSEPAQDQAVPEMIAPAYSSNLPTIAFVPSADAPSEAVVGATDRVSSANPPPTPSPAPEPETTVMAEPFVLPLQNAARVVDRVQALGLPAQRSQRVIEAEKSLIEQLSRAASQGLIDADLSQTKNEVAEANRLVDPLSAPRPETPTFLADSDAANSHFRIETQNDRDRPNLGSRVELADNGHSCLPNSLFDVAAWGELEEKGIQLADFRSGLVSEFDSVERTQIKRLAKYYIYLGFGAEAQSTLRHFGTTVGDDDIYMAMADIMDHQMSDNPGRLEGQLNCDTAAALWATLALPVLTPGDVVNTSAVMSNFSSLPLHMRRLLGAKLARKFLSVSDKATALAIRNAVSRADGETSDGFQLLEAEIAASEGRREQSQRDLDSIVAADGPLAPFALISKMDDVLAAGGLPSESEIELALALAYEYGNEPYGQDLLRVALESKIAGRETVFSLRRLATAVLKEEVDDSVAMRLRSLAFQALSVHDTDVAFLKEVLHPTIGRDGIQNTNAATKTAVATRLVDLGFADEARDLLNQIVEAPNLEQRILSARIALAQQRPEIALGYLAGLTGETEEALRAEAFAQAKDFTRASESYARLDQVESQTTAAWRSGDWQTVTDLPIGPLSDAAALALQDIPEMPPVDARLAPNEPGVIAHDRQLLENSQKTRQILDSMFAGLDGF